MIIQITDKCSRGCKHCLLNCTRDNDNFMKLDVFKFLVNKIANKTLNIIISGGEPLLHEDILEMVEYALSRTNFLVTILTSGINIDVLRDLSKEYSKRLMIQITNDARYYPQNKFVTRDVTDFMKDMPHLSVQVVDEIKSITTVGRAKDNNIEAYGRTYVGCINSLLVSVQHDIENIFDWLSVENRLGKMCLSMIDYNLDFYLGECKKMHIGNLKDEEHLKNNFKFLKHNLRSLECSECGHNNIDEVMGVLISSVREGR